MTLHVVIGGGPPLGTCRAHRTSGRPETIIHIDEMRKGVDILVSTLLRSQKASDVAWITEHSVCVQSEGLPFPDAHSTPTMNFRTPLPPQS